MSVQITRGDDAVAYLTRLKYKISRSTFYRHIRDGKIPPAPWTPDDLDHYAKTHLAHGGQASDRRGRSQDKTGLQADRLSADIRAKLAMAELRELQVKIETGLYVDREEHERLLTLEVFIFRDCLKNFCRAVPPVLAASFDIESERIPEIGDMLIDLAERELSQYHGKKFKLSIFDREDDDGSTTKESG